MSSDKGMGLSDRIYSRFGSSMLAAFAPVAWTLNALVQCVLIVALARIYPLSAGQIVELAVWMGGLWLVCVTISLIHMLRITRPLRSYERGEASADEAWRAVVVTPVKALKFNYAFAILLIPIAFLILSRIVPINAWLAGIVLWGIAGAWLYQLAIGSFLATQFIRPALRSIEADLHGVVPSVSGMRLFEKTVFVIPALGVAMAMFGAALAVDTRGDHRAALMNLLAVTAFAAVAAVPVSMLFARSVNLPIDDLLEGTRRVKAGDYSTPVPALSTDELGDLARSFNEAMEGLAERQQLGREVRASRARIVAAADESRKRIERNLHDGAQQRLVALAMDLKLNEEMASAMTTDQSANAFREAAESAREALAELRELARGLHPQILSTDGLGPALLQLASRSKVPVRVDSPAERFPEPVETAAYFVVAEALANVSKYAKAESAQVTVQTSHGSLTVEVADDGVGGASLGAGTGLAGLADRVAALDGRLTVDSPPGAGTKVRAEIPVRG
ncbi:histidine kinase [Smaragdicoccus niigatensis]|uniref:sensor histidine kinase n=1 Tax=Smaragdicoccus niigatensis TaxID=359359 RepID=UPI0003800DD6|nr:histidine kinase [Smaragdicoccus niigatensis]